MVVNQYLLGRMDLRNLDLKKIDNLSPENEDELTHEQLIWMIKNTDISRIICRGFKYAEKFQKSLARWKCEYCNGPVYQKNHVHVNICQDPQERIFCTKKCKQIATTIKEA